MTALTDGVGVRLCLGLIDVLVQDGLVVWQPDTPYPATMADPAGFLASYPGTPDRICALTPYGADDEPGQSGSTVYVQVRTRWAGQNPTAVMNYSAAIFDSLHGLGPRTLTGGVSISQCLRASTVSMGQDTSKRWGWSDNYSVDLDWPSKHRT